MGERKGVGEGEIDIGENVRLFCGKVGLFCGSGGLFCHAWSSELMWGYGPRMFLRSCVTNVRLFCGNVGLFCGNVGLSCGNVGLFCHLWSSKLNEGVRSKNVFEVLCD